MNDTTAFIVVLAVFCTVITALLDWRLPASFRRYIAVSAAACWVATVWQFHDRISTGWQIAAYAGAAVLPFVIALIADVHYGSKEFDFILRGSRT
ncbi:MAG TPA: hypothetical protein VEH48_00765 [Candidatus Nitrosopolaris sp.]|nr:hypothetical protein [Candidatus Nitrosopolaris sp.]